MRISTRDLYEVKRAAYSPDRHLSSEASKASVTWLVAAGLAEQCGAGCRCGWYVVTDDGVELAAAHGIARTSR